MFSYLIFYFLSKQFNYKYICVNFLLIILCFIPSVKTLVQKALIYQSLIRLSSLSTYVDRVSKLLTGKDVRIQVFIFVFRKCDFSLQISTFLIDDKLNYNLFNLYSRYKI